MTRYGFMTNENDHNAIGRRNICLYRYLQKKKKNLNQVERDGVIMVHGKRTNRRYVRLTYRLDNFFLNR